VGASSALLSSVGASSALLSSVGASSAPVSESGAVAIEGLMRALRVLPSASPTLARALCNYLKIDNATDGDAGCPRALARLQLACSSQKGCNPCMLMVAVAQLPREALPPVVWDAQGARVRSLTMVVAGELLAHRMWCMLELIGVEKALGCFSFGAEVGSFAVALPERVQREAVKAVAVTRLLLSSLDAVFKRRATLAAAVDAGGEHGVRQACLEAVAFGTRRADASGTRLAPPPCSAPQERSAALALRSRLLVMLRPRLLPRP
jgi:hypothetical protein